ncbi:MAG: alpha/beta fold hydrolase [Oscillospiraceae bacterium]|nr:alpha/beta fold hydrolase [Oscillospiraceae bacterium]MBQ9045854.1 alpha/beta fold hydrolase [Oscillospiraceae bacterium]
MKTERFEIQQDGLTIKGKHYIPERRLGSPVILSHEFGLNMLSAARYARPLCAAGFSVYVFDFSGSGSGISRGRSSRDMSVLTEKEDLSLVLDEVKARERCQRVILGGCSQGGLVTALLAAERADEVESVFLVYPALSIPDDARRGSMLGSRIDPEHIPERFTVMGYVHLGARYVADARSLDPWAEIRTYSRPVLLLHGTADGMVDVCYSRKAAKEYPNAEMIEIEGGRHLFLQPTTVQFATEQIIRFLEEKSQNNGGRI